MIFKNVKIATKDHFLPDFTPARNFSKLHFHQSKGWWEGVDGEKYILKPFALFETNMTKYHWCERSACATHAHCVCEGGRSGH